MNAVQPASDRLAQSGTVGAAQVVGASRVLLPGSGFTHNSGDDDAAPLLIGQANDAGLGHRIQAGESLLNVAGLHLDPTGDDDVVHAPQELQTPIGAQPAAVGGDQDAPGLGVPKILTGSAGAVRGGAGGS